MAKRTGRRAQNSAAPKKLLRPMEGNQDSTGPDWSALGATNYTYFKKDN